MLGQPVSMLVPQVVGFKLTRQAARRRHRHRPRAHRHRRCSARRAWSASSSSSTATASRRCRWPTAPRSPTWPPSTARPAASSRSTPRRSATSSSPAARRDASRLVEAYCKGAGAVPRVEHARGRLLRHARARPRDRRAQPGRPEAAAGPRAALRGARTTFREALKAMLRDPTRTRRAERRPRLGRVDPGERPAATRRRPRASRRRRHRAAHDDARSPPAGGRQVTTEARDYARPRLGRDRRDHELHEHVEPVGHDRRRPARQEGRRARAHAQAVGQGVSLAPGSKVVTDYLEQRRPRRRPRRARFNLVGYGCTTCIGNSGPLPAAISEAIHEDDLVAVAGPLGQPQLRGPDQPRRADELPRLAAAGRRLRAGGHDGHRPRAEPLGTDADGPARLPRDIWPTQRGDRRTTIEHAVQSEMFRK